MSITKEEILMGRVKYEDLSQELKDNLDKLVIALNVVRTAYGKPMIVSSGLRTAVQNSALANSAKKSLHMVCKACDFKDDGTLDAWCLANQDLLESAGLWQESPDSTPTWCHLDISTDRSTKIKRAYKRVFNP